MPIAAPLIIAGGTLAAGALSAHAASSAAGTQSAAALQGAKLQYQAAQDAIKFQQGIYNSNQGNLAPFIDTGKNASYSLASLYGMGPNGTQGTNDQFNNFTNLPAYQFPLQQGQRAITNSMNAQGLGQSGAFAKGIADYTEGLASTYMMNNYVNPLMTMSGQGVTAGSALTGTNATMGNIIGNNITGAGSALGSGVVGSGAATAAGQIGSANAIGSGINSGISNLMLYSMLAKNGATSGFNFWGNNNSGSTFGSPNLGSPMNLAPSGSNISSSPTYTGSLY